MVYTATYNTTVIKEKSNTYSFIIHYVFEDGSQAAEDFVREGLKEGELSQTGIYSPNIAGFTPSYTYISLGPSGMPAKDVEVWVTYTKTGAGNNDENPVEKGGIITEDENGFTVSIIEDNDVPRSFIGDSHKDCIIPFLCAILTLAAECFYEDKRKKYQSSIQQLKEKLLGGKA